MKGKSWQTLLSIGVIAAAADIAAAEVFYRFALTQKMDKSVAFNAPHNRPTLQTGKAPRDDKAWLRALPHTDWLMVSEDGLRLHAICVETQPGAPWAVLCHGYTGKCVDMAEFAREFYAAGFNLLLPDARGHGQSEGGYIGMGWPERRDVCGWVNRINERCGAPDIVLMGVSMGGATVMMTSGEALPENVRAIVEDCGYTSAWDEFRYQMKRTFSVPPFPVLYTTDALLRRRAGFSMREASAVQQLKKCRTPMLFIHGGKDAFVPFEMLNRVYAAASCPKELYIVPEAGHAESRAANPERYWQRVFGFLNRWMTLPDAAQIWTDAAQGPEHTGESPE